MICEQCGCLLPDGVSRCPNCGLDYDLETVMVRKEETAQEQKEESEKKRHTSKGGWIFGYFEGMDWIDWVVWVQLIATIFFCVFSGIRLLFGYIADYSGENMKLLFSEVEGLRALTIVKGIVLLSLAAFAVIVRIRLMEMNTNGPVLYLILMTLIVGYELISVGEVSYLINIPLKRVIVRNWQILYGSIAFWLVGIYYFVRKRSEFWC